ncbi:type I restriction endonuclease subunit R [Methanocorpusculum vombati]|uniref:type I site-specific deoxyribonuclease n=1 Tax=Methanocorpusculum vombati TaxID=3002864 RepID=A0ABT4IKY6_9EURY|nr:type I restriction endonuclease subunit R [Methanocorpusculum vombati]MCZ0862408.1 type I restriction endonuclease subunit R [Methanocorpusculum vombati]MDE2534270.1 type I restriction endonuclease subunit R [Methanocorpusculum sp.]MDE2548862.1 type I restriction endonuclease subunit R [Methanocorpusculum sp.]
MSFTEANFENAVLELIQSLGYTYRYGPDIPRDYHNPLYEDDLLPSLQKINPKKPAAAVTEAVTRLKTIDAATLTHKNIIATDYLQNGIPVKYFDGREERSDLIRLIDHHNPENNTFTVINQWTVIDNAEKRPDIVIFVNGIPVIVIELKSPSRENTDVSEAYRQLRNYLHDIPSLFIYNALCIMSDQATSKAGTITAKEDRYMEWKTTDGNYENTSIAAFDVLFEGILEKNRLIDILKNFICYSRTEDSDTKILAAYHQYFAVRKAVESTKTATKTDGKGGVFWHTQGSGKSLSMVFYAKLLQTALESPTIVVITDRNDLDNQLFSQFSNCKDYLRQTPIQAESRTDLRQLLAGRKANGIIFTTMQKFEESDDPLSLRRNIIVIADEAHRSQYGLEEKINATTGKISVGTARKIRDSLPNATYIGFTGTPISSKDRSTREIFGDYIDIYDMTQSVEDGATRPVYYESRVINLHLNETILHQIDLEYDIVAEEAPEYIIEKSKHELSKLESILAAPQTIDALCSDIVAHYETNRQYELTGKAMIVAYSRDIAMKIYHKILDLRPAWQEKIGVVMTSANNDPEEWRQVIGTKAYRDEMAKKFKDNTDPLKIAIVVDMWLTGFDVPSLATMYVYKPMSGHNLMQAIARVNRVFGDKEGGLVVDYVGIARDLRQAMHDYTRRDRHNYGDTDISKVAKPKFDEKLEVCRDLLHGYDYSGFSQGTDLDRARAISGGVDFLSAPAREETKKIFIKESLALRQALSLCRSLLHQDERLLAAYFEAVRTLLTRVESKGQLSLRELNARINELLKQSIQSEGVINLFSDIKQEFSLFDPKFLEDIAKMKEKNLAVELLKRLLADQISVYQRTNLVQSERFSELLSRAMSSYLKGMLTNEQVIEELLGMAKDMISAHAAGEKLGLTVEETAFYDALTKPAAVKDFYENEELIAITRELTDLLRKNKTIDWQKKETARAGMRRLVKRLLKEHHYPPEGMEDAVNTVIRQCELWTDAVL